jgi:hypothetical protein
MLQKQARIRRAGDGVTEMTGAELAACRVGAGRGLPAGGAFVLFCPDAVTLYHAAQERRTRRRKRQIERRAEQRIEALAGKGPELGRSSDRRQLTKAGFSCVGCNKLGILCLVLC